MKQFHQGMSLIEVILAMALFVIFATGVLGAVLQGFDANRLSAEQTIANQFAQEGIDAVRSVKNQSFSNLTSVNPTPRAVVNSSGTWALGADGTNSVFSSGKTYTRTVKVEPVQRDAIPPDGNIVSSGGTNDTSTKKITSSVTWNFNVARAESVDLVTYITNWKKPLVGNGIVVYSDSTSLAQPKYRIFTDNINSFNPQGPTGSSFTDTVVGTTFRVRTSPTKSEAIVGYVNSLGTLRVLCFDGSNWTSEWSTNVGGNGRTRRFDIAYETQTGDVLIVYSKNASGSNQLGYRTKPGSTGCGVGNWSLETTVSTVQTSGTVQWVRLEGNPLASSNNAAVAWTDDTGGLSAMQWTGSSFGISEPSSPLETTLERITSAGDSLSFDLAFESLSGNLMIVWGQNASGNNCSINGDCNFYARYTNGWTLVTPMPTQFDPSANISLSTNPTSNEIVMGGISNGPGNGSTNNLSLAYWSLGAWTVSANVDTSISVPVAGSKLVSTGWLTNGSLTQSVITYDHSGARNISYFTGSGSNFTQQPNFTPTPLFANPQSWYQIELDPVNRDRLMFVLSDNGTSLYAKRLVMASDGTFTWTNSDGSSALDTALGQSITSPFSFAYWRSP